MDTSLIRTIILVLMVSRFHCIYTNIQLTVSNTNTGVAGIWGLLHISCTKSSQVAGLIQKVSRSSLKASSLQCSCLLLKDTCRYINVASSPGHSQILSRSRFSPRLCDEIYEWPGNEANINAHTYMVSWHHISLYHYSVCVGGGVAEGMRQSVCSAPQILVH